MDFFRKNPDFARLFCEAVVMPPLYLAQAFGGIALATAPAAALSIVQEFHTKGPVTRALLPMAVLDDIVAIVVFFTVNSFIAKTVSGGAVPLYMIPVMILLPHSGVSLVFTGIVCSVLTGPEPDLAVIVKGTIAAAAVINEIIAVLAAKKGFELAGEIDAA